MRLNRVLGPLLAALLLAALSACGGSDDAGEAGEAGDSAGSGQPQQDAAGPQPDLDGVPEVVAEVNGEEIGKDEFTAIYTQQFQQMASQSQSTGQEVDQDQLKKQVVDNMVNAELLVQEAGNRGFDASEQQTDAALETLAKQNGMKSSDELVSALEQQGMDREVIDAQIADQVRIDQLLADVGGDTKPTEKELRSLYADLKAQQGQSGGQGGQKIPPFEQVRPQLEDQLTTQQESEVAGTLVKDLRREADIQVHI